MKSSVRMSHERFVVVLIFAIGLAGRLFYFFITPDFYAPDEIAHWNYVQRLHDTWQLPTHSGVMAGVSNDWENFQPPLYYAVAALWGSVFPNTLDSLRVFSLLLWIGVFWLGMKTLDHLRVSEISIRALALTVIACLPTYSFSSGFVSNDSLLCLLGAAFTWLITRSLNWKSGVALGVVTGAALWTKAAAIVLCVWLFFTIVIALLRRERSTALAASIALIMAALLFIPLALHNLHTWGSVTGEHVSNIRSVWINLEQAIERTWQNIADTFWAVSGRENNVRLVPPLGVMMGTVAIGGLIAIHTTRGGLALIRSTVLLAVLPALLVHFVLLMRFGIIHGQTQGRHLFLLLVPIAILMSAGWTKVFSGRSWWVMGASIIAYSLGLMIYSYVQFPRG